MEKDFLIVMAMEEESGGLFEEEFGDGLLFTGVGKVNAAHRLMKRLMELRAAGREPQYVINVGSCGSRKHRRGSLVCSNRFIQRDMDASAFGYEKGVTPSDDFPLILEHRDIVTDLPNALCGSGDSFVTDQEVDPRIDVVEMEAYALARVCKIEGLDFIAIKYITDGLTEDGGSEWREELKNSNEVMFEYVKGLVKKL